MYSILFVDRQIPEVANYISSVLVTGLEGLRVFEDHKEYLVQYYKVSMYNATNGFECPPFWLL